MAGHVRKRGTWEFIVDLGDQPCRRCDDKACNKRVWDVHAAECPKCGGTMRRRVERRQRSQGGYSTRRDAERALREAEHARDRGGLVDPSRVTVADYLRDEWLTSREPATGGRGHRGQVSLGTWATYRSDLEAHVVPRIGQIRLQALTGADLTRLYDELERSGGRRGQGLSPKTVSNVHGALHKALADAVRLGRLARNPADAVDAPRPDRPPAKVWTVAQLRRFLEHVADDRLYAAWLLFATTGMRRAEVAGLAWGDVDLDAGQVRVSWTLGVVDSKTTWKPRPKSKAGERTLALDPATVDALRAHRVRHAAERLKFGPGWQATAADWRGQSRDDVVFTWADGSPINPQRFTKWFTNHCHAAGLPAIRLHDVRHTYATAALANATGWHEVKVLSQRLGHASVGITLDTYSHVLPAADKAQAETLARVILGG